jgi:hypothetical protein
MALTWRCHLMVSKTTWADFGYPRPKLGVSLDARNAVKVARFAESDDKILVYG